MISSALFSSILKFLFNGNFIGFVICLLLFSASILFGRWINKKFNLNCGMYQQITGAIIVIFMPVLLILVIIATVMGY